MWDKIWDKRFIYVNIYHVTKENQQQTDFLDTKSNNVWVCLSALCGFHTFSQSKAQWFIYKMLSNFLKQLPAMIFMQKLLYDYKYEVHLFYL